MFFERRSRWSLFSSVSLTAIAVGAQALANPTGPVVITGDIGVAGLGTSQVIVDNGSMRSIVDWQEFSIGAGETTTINQISSDAAILNRVTGGNLSEIYGSLTSNGQVYLINENGIVIGASGQVETGGFVASTLDTSNAEFLGAGDMVFSQGITTGGGITVHGKIRSISGGDIFLLSREIEISESGEIDTAGHVGLGAGEEILLRPTDSGEGRISIRTGKGRITNRGAISGAVAELKATGGNEYALAINNTGVVRATGVSRNGGRVMLTGGGKLRNTGKITATRKIVVRSATRIENSGMVKAGDGNNGGEIVFDSPDIIVQAGSLLDVSGALGGGRMFIGGGFQGTGKDRAGNNFDISANSTSTSVEAGAILDASATQSGDAGQIIVWADGTTTFAGQIVASANQGRGGFAEVSGKHFLNISGLSADLGGASGGGTLLLDPDNINISDSTATGVNVILDSDIEALLQAGTNVTILTGGAVGTANVAGFASGGGADVGFVAIEAGVRIQWSNSGNAGNDNALLTISAADNIVANDDILIQNTGTGDVETNEGGVILRAGKNVFIGDASMRTGIVAIGSEFGVTTVVAGDSNGGLDPVANPVALAIGTGSVFVRGGDDDGAGAAVNFASAQIGYILDGIRADSDANGTITVLAGGAVDLKGGTGPAGTNGLINFAQIGHGGTAAFTRVSFSAEEVIGDIIVNALENIAINGGSDVTSAAIIGHGAITTNYSPGGFGGPFATATFAQGNISGDITVTAGTDIAINTGYAPIDGGFDPVFGDTDSVIGRIGHGAVFSFFDFFGTNADPMLLGDGSLQFGMIQGDIEVTAPDTLTVGPSLAPLATDDNYFVASTIGHGGTGVTYLTPVNLGGTTIGHTGTNAISHADIRGFDTGADIDTINDYSTNITVFAGATQVQAIEIADNSAGGAGGDNNLMRSQIGHSPLSVVSNAFSVATNGHRIEVVEGRIAGDISVFDTDKDDARGITLQTGIVPGLIVVTQDIAIARIGHASGQLIFGLDGAGNGSNGSNVSILQAHIFGANIRVDTRVFTGAVETDDQDISLISSIAAGLLPALDNTTTSQIGHGGDTFVTTGIGGDAGSLVNDPDAGDGGDITIGRGTIWDGALEASSGGTQPFAVTNPNNILVFSSNQIIVDSDTAAGLASAERNTSEAQIGHGFRMRLETGDGGNSGIGTGSGGAGGDVLVFQSVDARDYGLADGFDDYARGTRGNITLFASATTAAAGDYAVVLTSNDASALALTDFNSDYALAGHSDFIEITTGNGSNGSDMGAGNAFPSDSEGDDISFGDSQQDAAGGRGGHIDVQLGRLGIDQPDIVSRDFGENLADKGDTRLGMDFALAGVMLTEGDITVQASGAILLDSTVANALAPAEHALTESVIGHGTRMFADSGDGGDGGSGNFQANDETVFKSEEDGEEFLNYESHQGSNRGGNGGDIRLTHGDISDRFDDDAGTFFLHDTDADNSIGSTIFIFATDFAGAHLPDSLIIRSQVLAGLSEGNGADVNSLIGHHVRLFGEGGSGGDGGSSNTEFDADGNSLFDDGTIFAQIGQTDTQNMGDAIDETALQAGAVFIQPNSSGGRGGDVLLVNGNIKGDVQVVADRRVTVETTAGHGVFSKVTSQIGHSTDLFAATQFGGFAGRLFEAPDLEATFDGGVIGVGDSQSDENASTADFEHLLIDGNQDDEFNLAGNGDANSTVGEDGIAVTVADLTNRTGSTFTSIAADGVLGVSVAGTVPGATTGVIFHDEEADPNFILDPNTGLLVVNDETNNALFAENGVNLARFGRVVATYDGFQAQGGDLDGLSLEVFVDMDQDGDVDLVDFDRDGRLDVVDLDSDGLMDQIDGRANYVVSSGINGVTGLGVLDYAAVSGKSFDPVKFEGGWTLRNELRTANLLGEYNGKGGSDITALVGDFSTANGGRGGDAYTQVGYSSGDISVSTGDNDLGQATSLVVSVNLTDDPVAGGGNDYHRALIGHGAWQVSDAAALFANRRAGRENGDGGTDIHNDAHGGDANFYAANASGGRGGNAFVIQGVDRDNNPDLAEANNETDHLVGHVFINTPNPLDGSFSNDAKRIDITTFVDNDYGNNVAIAQFGHSAEAFAISGDGGNGASHQGPGEGPNGSSQTEIANGGDGGDTRVSQHFIKGLVTVMTGADDADGSDDVSLRLTAENGAAIAVSGSDNTLVSQIGHGRRAEANSRNGGDADDAQWLANGGNGGGAQIFQYDILDTAIAVDLVSFDAMLGTADPNGYFGNGMLISASDFHGNFNIVRAQVGHGDLALAFSGDAGDGTPEWVVNEQINQSANGGIGGDATIRQAGYNYDIDLDIGSNAAGGVALEILSTEASIFDGDHDHTLATVGHGGYAFALGGHGGEGGLEGAVNSLQTGTDRNLVDSDYDYSDGITDDGDTPYAIDAENRFHFGTDRRGGNAGIAIVNMNFGGTGRTIDDRENNSYDYGLNDFNGADIDIYTRDEFAANKPAIAGFDGIWIHSIAGPGSNQDSALFVNAAIVGHHGFGEASGSRGGNGIQSSLGATITEGDGGDGGTAIVTLEAIRGNIEVTNIGAVDLDNSGNDRSTNILIESTGGTIADSINNRAEARVGHFTMVMATGGDGGDASIEAGAPPAFPASLSAQGGDGGDALTYQGQHEGDIEITAENSVIVRALDGTIGSQVTVAAVGHRQQGRAFAGIGGFGGTAAAEVNAQSIYFIYEALREFHARGDDLSGLSRFEQKLVAPFIDYFENKPGELEVFLSRLIGDGSVVAANARDDDAIGGTNFTLAELTSGDGHIPASNDGEIETMLHILAASGHGGNAIVRQGSTSQDLGSDVLAANGDISITANSFDITDADRGYIQLAHADALAGGMQMTHLGHQAEIYAVRAGRGEDLNGQNADANGIGGDGGDAIADQYALNGGISVISSHKITIQAIDDSLSAQEVRSQVGHRLNIGSDFTVYRSDPVVESGIGGSESGDVFDDGRNGNGGDVYIWQRGVVSGTERAGTDGARYSSEIALAALEDADDDISITIEALATGLSAPDVETHIGHDMLIASVKAGDSGRQGALTGPQGASEGLLEGNGGDIFIAQTHLVADIDIVGRDAVFIHSQTSTSGGNWAHLVIGHERTIGESSDSDNPRSGTIIAGAGGDAHVEDVNASDLANADAADDGFLEDSDSGRIEITLGVLTDSFEDDGDGNDGNQRLITISSITEDLDVLSETALGTSHLEIGNQQQVIAETLEAADFTGIPLIQTAGDSGGVYIARNTISGDIVLQALDADRASSAVPANGKQVTIRALTAIGDAQLQIGHETEFAITTGRSGFGEDRTFLAGNNLATFIALFDPATVADNVAGQATIADAQNAIEDMEDLVRALELASRYADRLPADDGVLDANDRGDLLRNLLLAQVNLADARTALAAGNIGEVQNQAIDLAANASAFQSVYDTIPQTGSLIADFADAGDIVYGDLAVRGSIYTADLTIDGVDGFGSQELNKSTLDLGFVTGNIQLFSGRFSGVVADWRDVAEVVGNDDILADNFGVTGFTAADDLDDGVVLLESTANIGTALNETGHRRFMENTTGKGGGDTDAAPEEGGIAGDGGSIFTRNFTAGNVDVFAEEVVVTLGGGAGAAELHLLHSEHTVNTAFWSDIQTLMGAGGNIVNQSTVYGGAAINAERIATALDAQDRTLQATGAATTFLQLGHQVTTENTSFSDPNEAGNVGDTQDNLGSNRGGSIISTQEVGGDQANGALVSISLDANGDEIEGDLIIMTSGVGGNRIRLGNGGQTGDAAGEITKPAAAFNSGLSGTNNDDGGSVSLFQDVDGDIVISLVEDLAIRSTGAADNDIWIGHAAEQIGQSGEINGAADGNPQYGEQVQANQSVTGELVFSPWSSFEALITSASIGELHIGHEAQQTAFSADDSGDPSDFDPLDNGASRIGINDSFIAPDVIALQTVSAGISIITGEIVLTQSGTDALQIGHEAIHIAAVDGDRNGVAYATDNNPLLNGKPSGFVSASSIINGDGSDIVFTATGATGQTDSVVVAVNGTQGDITLQVPVGSGILQVGHSSTSTMSDGPGVIEGFYQTLQAIGSSIDVDGNGEVDDTSASVIVFTAAQDIELLQLASGTAHIGHFITETGPLQVQGVAVNDLDGVTGIGANPPAFDSHLLQTVGSDIVLGNNSNQGSGGVGTGGAGNNIVVVSDGGLAIVGHRSPDDNQWQVEAGVRSVTQQLLDGDITLEAGTDAGVDAPDGSVAGAGDESGLGDDILLDERDGELIIGHDQANAAEGIANETQVSAGDIWLRAGGDLHDLAAIIGHNNYDFGTFAPNINNATPESLASASPIRNRIRGNTTIGAGQNSAAEDSTLISDVLVIDATNGTIRINSGYGGQGDADVDGELRFFLPAQQGLTIVNGTINLNDSDLNGDPVGADRSGDPSNVFAGTGGTDHEHPFAFQSETQPYTDQFIGLGNFTFYFENPASGSIVTHYTPYIDVYDFNNGFSVVYRDENTGAAVNSGTVGNNQVVGTGSNEVSCNEEEASQTSGQPGVCDEIVENYQGQVVGYGSNSQFQGTAGGNQTFQQYDPVTDTGFSGEGGGINGYRSIVPLASRIADQSLTYAINIKPANTAVAPALVLSGTGQSSVIIPALQIKLPVNELAYSAHAGSPQGAALLPLDDKSYGEYLRGDETAEEQIRRQFGPAMSIATPLSVYVVGAL